MTKAYSYIRFSSPEQAKGDSLRRQLEAARAWCVERGLDLDDTLRDLGRSAFKGRHAQFGALRAFLDLVEAGEIERGSYLIVESLDRLSREAVLDAAARLFDLIRAGITVVTLSDGQEYSQERLRTDWTPLVISLAVMARAHDESRTKSIRIGRAWEQKRRRAVEEGQAMTALCPGWLKLVGGPKRGHYEIIPERADIVRGIFDDTLAGLGRRSIARRLNERKVPTWGVGRKAGSRWHDSYIQKILGNPAVFGRFEPLAKLSGGSGNGHPPIDNYYPAILDEATFYAAQAIAKSRGAGQGRTSATHRNLLRGIAICNECGGGMNFVDKGARSAGPKLICGRANAAAGCEHRAYYSYQPLEIGTIFAVGRRIDELMLNARDRTSALRADRDALAAKRQSLSDRLDNLIELVAASGGGDRVAAQVAQLQSEIDAADAVLADYDFRIRGAGASDPDHGADVGDLYRQLEGLDDEERPRARATLSQKLRGLVDRVEIGPARARVVMSDGGVGEIGTF